MTATPAPRPLVKLTDILPAVKAAIGDSDLNEAALAYVITNYINPGAVHSLNWALLQDPVFMEQVQKLIAERLVELIEKPPIVMDVIALIEARLEAQPELSDTAAVEAVLADEGKFWNPGRLLGQLVDAHIKIIMPSDAAGHAHQYNFNAAMSEKKRRTLERQYAQAQLVVNLSHIVNQRRINRAS